MILLLLLWLLAFLKSANEKNFINIKIHKKSYEHATMYACAKDRAHIAALNWVWQVCGESEIEIHFVAI